MNLENLPLLIILVLAVLGNNHTVSIAASALLLLKLLGLTQSFPHIEAHGISIGVIILTMAVLTPLAEGRISAGDIVGALKAPTGAIAVIVGIFVAWVAAQGIPFMKGSPEAVTALITGTIIGVCFFKGLAVGPLIAGGMVSLIVSLCSVFKH